MCGRYALHSSPEVVALAFGLREIPAFPPRYNIAPTANVLVIRATGAAPASAIVRWGLVPRWAKDPSMGARMNNARAETAAEKPSFREAYRRRRCLIPADGFYEWKPERGVKQPYYIRPATGPLFAFAGLWEAWQGPDHEGTNRAAPPLETCAILTTEANEKMARVHERMPVIVSPAEYSAWLAGAELPLGPCTPDAIVVQRVSRAVSNARNEGPGLLETEDEPGEG